MTLVLGLIAGLLLFGLIGLIIKSNNQDDVLAFTTPQDLNQALRAQPDLTQPSLTQPDLTQPSIQLPDLQVPRPSSSRGIPASRPAHDGGSAASDFYPGNLGVGTTLHYRRETSEIQGVISFDYEGEVWQDYIASLSGGRWWRLGVEPDRNMRLVAFSPIASYIEPGRSHVTYEGQTFTQTDSGPANYRTVGHTGHFPQGKYWFFDYRNDSGQILNFERFDSGPWIGSIGRVVHPAEVQVDNFTTDETL